MTACLHAVILSKLIGRIKFAKYCGPGTIDRVSHLFVANRWCNCVKGIRGGLVLVHKFITSKNLVGNHSEFCLGKLHFQFSRWTSFLYILCNFTKEKKNNRIPLRQLLLHNCYVRLKEKLFRCYDVDLKFEKQGGLFLNPLSEVHQGSDWHYLRHLVDTLWDIWQCDSVTVWLSDIFDLSSSLASMIKTTDQLGSYFWVYFWVYFFYLKVLFKTYTIRPFICSFGLLHCYGGSEENVSICM